MAASMSADQNGFVREVMLANLPLAAHCACAPDVNISATLKDELRMMLLARAQNSEADLRARLAAALALGELGDTRFKKQMGKTDSYITGPFVSVEHGQYFVGSDDGEYADESPMHRVEINTFYIAQFPVTNAEFQCFIDAGGYENDSWWELPQAQAWRRGEGVIEGQRREQRTWRTHLRSLTNEDIEKMGESGRITSTQVSDWLNMRNWNDEEFESWLNQNYSTNYAFKHPAYWSNPNYVNPSQPVVGVSWYETRAYCNWLSAQTGRRYRLPTEPEWEAAARGRQGRRYSYGMEFDSSICNTFSSYIRRPNPVGMFPKGNTATGLADMTGNVWEWTSSPYIPYPYQPEQEVQFEKKAEIKRVLKGGSWFHKPLAARAARRFSFSPDIRYDYFGFRLVRDDTTT